MFVEMDPFVLAVAMFVFETVEFVPAVTMLVVEAAEFVLF